MLLKSEVMRTGYVEKMGKQGIRGDLWWGNLLKNNHLEGLEVDGKIILGWILGR